MTTDFLIGMFLGLLLAIALVVGAIVVLLLLQHFVNVTFERSRRNDRRRMEKGRK